MTDATKDRLNPALEGRYRIERELGEGGMATVYLADDLKHERKVALKVLKPELAAVVGAERFLAEIKTTANLQHPHILPLFDSGEADSFLFYVMPYVEGETLKDRINREKQLPVDEAVRIASAVSQALQHAHDRGVIHRDIKPGNILLQDGQPVVSDFGIALAVGAGAGTRLTETGLSVGTPFYMSPEQATGDQHVGPPSDTYSLAAVLYEMLTGDPPYSGSTAQAVLGKIIQGALVSATQIRNTVPPNVDAAIRKALEILPADRFRAAQDFAKALADPAFRHGQDVAAGASGGRSLWNPLSVAMSALAAAAVLWIAVTAFPRAGEAPAEQAVIRMPIDSTVFNIAQSNYYVLSPDGSMLAYRRASPLAAGPTLAAGPITVIDMDTGLERTLPGTEETNPLGYFFSPDGRQLAYSTVAGIYRMSVQGGAAISVRAEAGTAPILSHWDASGFLYYSTVEGMYRVREQEEPELLLNEGLLSARNAWPLPGGREVLYTAMVVGTQVSEIRLLDTETGETRLLIEDGFDARYLPTGHLIYGRFDQSVVAVPFDVERGEPGVAVPVIDSVMIEPTFGTLLLTTSSDGTMIHNVGGVPLASGEGRLVFVQSDGTITPSTIAPGILFGADLSPDGGHLAFGRNNDIVVVDLLTGEEVVAPGTALRIGPVWSPDGSRLAFSGLGGGGSALSPYTWDVFGGEEPRAIESGYASMITTDWTPEGDRLITDVQDLATPGDIVTMNPDGSAVTPYLQAPWSEYAGVVTPDGLWLAYVSDETGEQQILLRSFPAPGEALTLATDVDPSADLRPALWGPDGRTLYYVTPDSVKAVELEFEPEPRVVSRRALFSLSRPEGRLTRNTGNFSHHPERGFVLVLNPALDADPTPPAPPRAYLVVNWFRELRELVGGN